MHHKFEKDFLHIMQIVNMYVMMYISRGLSINKTVLINRQ